jgi:hypothetical protein
MRWYPALIVFFLYILASAGIHAACDPWKPSRGTYIKPCRQPLQIECVHTIKTEVYGNSNW